MFRGILRSGLRRRASSESAGGLWIFAFWQIGLVKLIPPGCNFGSLRYAKRYLLGGRIACGSDQPDKRQTEMSVCLSGFFVFWRSLGMDFLNRSIKSIYFKYLSAAFGSAMISSVYSIVDVAMVGQYTRVRQALRPWRWWLRCGISSTVWGLLMGIGGSVIFSACRGGASSSGGVDGGVLEENQYFMAAVLWPVVLGKGLHSARAALRAVVLDGGHSPRAVLWPVVLGEGLHRSRAALRAVVLDGGHSPRAALRAVAPTAQGGELCMRVRARACERALPPSLTAPHERIPPSESCSIV